MERKERLAACLAVFLLSGCVWSTDYKARLAEIDALQKNAAGLQGRLRETEEELADAKRRYDELLERKNALDDENEAIRSTLKTRRDQLTGEVVELKTRLAETRRTVANHEKELEARAREVLRLKEEAERLRKEKEQAIAGMKSTYDSLVEELKQEIKEGEVQITQLKDKLTVNLVEKILFASGSAIIKKNGKKVLDRVAEILKGVGGRQIRVEGHTDDVPIGPAIVDRFPTNWELSTARATTVVRYLQERGVAPEVMSAEGYAEFRPVAPNDTDEGRTKNRRIEIVLVPLEEGR